GRTATSTASMPAFAMSCSTARFSTLCARPRSSSRVGDATTSRSGPTPQSDTSHQHQRGSCPHSPRGRLRYAAGHAGATANLKLTFHLDHSAGADQVLPDKLGLDFPEPQRIHFILSCFDNGAETLSRPMCAEGVL